ncbi:MAG TPA: SiaB family protein kinase [Bacteroidales bacterium]|nr:SiaB family protein kinase [Bacteroidales bacterium]
MRWIVKVTVVNHSLINYKGPFTFGTIDVLLTRFKLVSQEYDVKFVVYKRVISVMIEALENVFKYSDHFEDFIRHNDQYQPTFELVLNSESLVLNTGNPIRKEHVDILRKKIEKVNDKTRQELKALYVETITNGKFSSKGGAGLGLIEMAKTSGQNINYSFEPISEQFSWYSFSTTFKLE